MFIWRWIMKMFNCHHKVTKGELLLGYGLHEIEIKVTGKPVTVYFSIKDPADSCCVCHGDVNKLGITIGKHGFVLHADIRTNTCLVEWMCKSNTCCE